MLTRLVRVQVILFVLIALVGVTYVGARYARLDSLFGGSGYVVHVQLPDSGGIFTNAEVTYRGVPIGRVGALRLIPSGVEVDLHIDRSAPPVPTDTEVAVADRSAVGEQYVDLRPRRSTGPYLTDGAVVTSNVLPLPVEDLVRNLDRLVASVPNDDLRTVVNELYDATRDTGPSLQVLLDSTASFTHLATTHLPSTTQLITDAGTVLNTQIASADAIKSFGTNAKLIASSLRDSDADIRTLLATTPDVARQVTALLQETGPRLGVLLANLLTTSQVALSRHDNLEQLLITTPAVVSAANNIFTGNSAHFSVVTTYFQPLPCSYDTPYRNGLDTSPGPFNTAARCIR
jgi:phospholipid/cholesterol/gamma-HCH transport system substrate-binding protein